MNSISFSNKDYVSSSSEDSSEEESEDEELNEEDIEHYDKVRNDMLHEDELIEPPFNYDLYSWFKKSELPHFIISILEDPYEPDSEKHLFVSKFVKRYMIDGQYRKRVQGMFVVFVDRKFHEIMYDFGSIMSIGTYRNSKLAIPIFERKLNDSYITVTCKNGVNFYFDHTPLKSR